MGDRTVIPEPEQEQETERVGLGGLWKQRKVWLLTSLALLLLAGIIVVASGAVFSSSSANPSNEFTAGILSSSNDKDNAAILTAQKMIPTDVKTGDVTIRNTGDVAGKFKLTAPVPSAGTKPNGGDLTDVLRLKVDEVTGASGSETLTPVLPDQAFKTAINKALGSWPAGEQHKYRFTVTFPEGGNDNQYMGSKAVNTYTWTATSS